MTTRKQIATELLGAIVRGSAHYNPETKLTTLIEEGAAAAKAVQYADALLAALASSEVIEVTSEPAHE